MALPDSELTVLPFSEYLTVKVTLSFFALAAFLVSFRPFSVMVLLSRAPNEAVYSVLPLYLMPLGSLIVTPLILSPLPLTVNESVPALILPLDATPAHMSVTTVGVLEMVSVALSAVSPNAAASGASSISAGGGYGAKA